MTIERRCLHDGLMVWVGRVAAQPKFSMKHDEGRILAPHTSRHARRVPDACPRKRQHARVVENSTRGGDCALARSCLYSLAQDGLPKAADI